MRLISTPYVSLFTQQLTRQKLAATARWIAPIAVYTLSASSARAAVMLSGTIDFSGATSLMSSFQTFAMYAGAVICLGSLIFAGIRLMTGDFRAAIPGLFGALFGAGVLGWGAGWISSLTGQSVGQ